MKHVRALPKGNVGLAVKLLLAAVVTSQLVACGGGGSTKTTTSSNQQNTTTSSDQKIPDAYRATSSNSTVAADDASDAPSQSQSQQTGKMKLSWSAPSMRTDGQPLSLAEIDGYRVYYGASKGEYVKGADVKNGAAQSITVTNVPVGNYYVVMTTYDVNGIESAYSESIKKKVL